MPRGYGTALQVLAGAFGGGATSLGQSRLDQSRLDERRDIEADRFRVEDEQWSRKFKADQENARLDREADAKRYDAEIGFRSRQLDILGGLTPAQLQRINALMEANPGMTYQQARIKVLTADADVRGTPYQNQPARPRPGGNRPSVIQPRATPADTMPVVPGQRSRGSRPF